MTKRAKKLLGISAGALTAFALWTIAVCTIDVQPIGPQGSQVGLATLNRWVHDLTGVNFNLYNITDWLGLVPVGAGMGFALLGLSQWIRRKNLSCVDSNILLLGGFYTMVLAAYFLFEGFAINYRPVLIDGFLESSYPSSTTLLVLCVMPTAALQLHRRIRHFGLRWCICGAIILFTVFMVAGRLLSGVHWVTDIIGGILLSAGLVTLYAATIQA